MKLIFLDVDGVLNHSETPEWENGTHLVIDKQCVAELYRIIDHTNAKIVLSSTWRHTAGTRKFLLRHINESWIIGKTLQMHMSEGNRNHDILEWLKTVYPYTQGWNEDPITRMAILDDERDADLGDGNFFKTDFYAGGLTTTIADAVITHLLKTGITV
jgi:hypothetical protein